MEKQRGQISVFDFFAVILLLAVAFPIIIMLGYFYDAFFPFLDNLAFSGIVKLMFQLVPVLLVILILAYPLLSSQVRRQGGYAGGFGAP